MLKRAIVVIAEPAEGVDGRHEQVIRIVLVELASNPSGLPRVDIFVPPKGVGDVDGFHSIEPPIKQSNGRSFPFGVMR